MTLLTKQWPEIADITGKISSACGYQSDANKVLGQYFENLDNQCREKF
jgi:hypothetical protein